MKKKKDVLVWSKKEKDQIKKIVEKYKIKYNLNSWIIDSIFTDGPICVEDYEGNKFITDALSSAMPDYEKNRIDFKPNCLERLRNKDMVYIEDVVKHELCHCLVQELADLSSSRFINKNQIIDAVERLTQRISRLNVQ